MRNRGLNKACEPTEEHKPLFKLDLPEIKPLDWKKGIVITGVVAVVGLGIGVAVGTQIFFGVASLIGLALLIESNQYIKYIVIKGNIFIDVAIFIASIYALGSLGPTIAGGLMITGFGYSAVLAPYIREREQRRRGLNK